MAASITSVSPPRGKVGTQITITGTGFSAANNAVTLGGVSQTLDSQGATEIVFTIAGGVTKNFQNDLVVTNNDDATSDSVYLFVRKDDTDMDADYLDAQQPGGSENVSVASATTAEAKDFERLAALIEYLRDRSITSGTTFRAGPGSTSVPSYAFTNDTDMGIAQRGAAGQFSMITSAVERGYWGGAGLTLTNSSALRYESDLYARRSAASVLTIDSDGADGFATLRVGKLTIPDGYGSIVHIQGPTDRKLAISAGSARELQLFTNGGNLACEFAVGLGATFYGALGMNFAGSSSAPAMKLSSGRGFYTHVTGGWAFTDGTGGKFLLNADRVRLASNVLFAWASGTNVDTASGDSFLQRESEAVIAVHGREVTGSADAEVRVYDAGGTFYASISPLGSQLPSYTVAGLPSASTAGRIIYVSDETGGATVAFSDGTNWRRVQDRAVVS